MMTSSLLNYRILKRLLFYLIAIAAYYFIIKRLVAFDQWSEIGKHFEFSYKQIVLGLAFIVLWGVNILSEVKKWQVLISPFKKITFLQSFIQFLAGSFTAVGSPGRIAEPGGRMLFVEKCIRVNVLLMTAIGGLIQNVVIFTIGLIVIILSGLPFKWYSFSFEHILAGIVVILIIVSIFILINVFKQKARLMWSQIRKVKGATVFVTLLLTILRYVTYNMQLFIVFQFFCIPISVCDFLLLSPLYFLIITFIPSFILADIGIRGSVALLVFGQLGMQEPVILFSILCLWVFNVVIPAVTGGWIIHKQKVNKW